MLNATQSKNVEAAANYFETLKQGDYYTQQEIAARWHGKSAQALGLPVGSEVTPEQFRSLLQARHPTTGEKLAQRVRKDRRPGVDLTFSVPKSVSLAWAINQDERLLDVLRESVEETMTHDIEPLACRRVRKGKLASSMHRQSTSNLVWADFLHKTARPIAGKPDPQIHVHCYSLNYTSDEGEHYAAELEEVFRQLPSLQAKFHARLIRRLRAAGYEVEKTSFRQSGRVKENWQLQGISRETIEKFSRRTEQIEELATKKGITDAAVKGQLGAKTRGKKEKGTSIETLRSEWRSRLTPEEVAAFNALKQRTQIKTDSKVQGLNAAAAVQFALDHHLYRQSTVERHQVVATALEQSLFLSPEEVEAAITSEEVIQKSNEVRGANRHYLTTREVLQAEQTMIAYAKEGRGTKRPLGKQEHRFSRDWLNEQQKEAVRHVLRSSDAVTAITGGAGTGKSSLMQEAAEAISKNNKTVFAFAPSTGARDVLVEKGFANANTVEHLIRNDKLHPTLKDQVIWLDEAGLMDVRSMNAVFRIASQQNARVVLSGDTRQHASPRRGEAMRLLEAEAGLNSARIDAIQRQKGQYKRAVELVSLGSTVVDSKRGTTGMLAGFDLLDRLGKIKEIAGEERHDVLAERYLKLSKTNKKPLVIAPSNAEGRQATAVIRARLRAAGAIGKELGGFQVLRSLNLSEAEKGEADYFAEPGLLVQFHQKVAGGFKRGERYQVCRRSDREFGLMPMGGGRLKPIPHQAAGCFEVYRKEKVDLAVGDKIRFSLSGKSSDGQRRISNGRIDEVQRIRKDGDLVLKSGITVAKDYGHLDLGYVLTSHGAQGKDADVSLAAIGSQSLPAVSSKQFYVTVSRGKADTTIYVENKAAVRRAIQSAGEQLSATELVRQRDPEAQRLQQAQRCKQHRSFLARVRDWWAREEGNRWNSTTNSNPIAKPTTPSQLSPGRS